MGDWEKEDAVFSDRLFIVPFNRMDLYACDLFFFQELFFG